MLKYIDFAHSILFILSKPGFASFMIKENNYVVRFKEGIPTQNIITLIIILIRYDIVCGYCAKPQRPRLE